MTLALNQVIQGLAMALAVLIIAGTADQAIGQPFGSQAKKQNKDLPENRAERLKNFVETPGVPRYEGKSAFIEGVVFRAATNGPSINMKFVVKDSPEKVLAWYMQKFEQGQWQIEKATADPKRRIGATRDRNICRVLVSNHPDPFYPTRVILTYRMYEPGG